jgi:hypothetical protein
MFPKLPRLWVTLMIGFVFILSVSNTAVFGGPPYQDRHFNLDSTPRANSSMVANREDGFVTGYTAGSGAGTCSTGTCARSLGGFGSGNCPPVQNAILRLWVPDGATVEINGQITRPQMLGGIHRGSRVYSLEGLEANRVSPCDIIVCCFDEVVGIHQRFHRTVAVQSGGYYELQFPDGFEQIGVTQEVTTPMFYDSAPAPSATPAATTPGTNKPEEVPHRDFPVPGPK